MRRRQPRSPSTYTRFPYTTLFRSSVLVGAFRGARRAEGAGKGVVLPFIIMDGDVAVAVQRLVNGLLRVGADILIRLRQMHHQRLADGMAFVKLLEIGRASCRE